MFFGSTASASIYDKKMAGQTLELSICVVDADGNGFAVTLPEANLPQADIDAGAVGSDVIMSITLEAKTNVALGTMVIIDIIGSTA